jgi:ribonuclease T1
MEANALNDWKEDEQAVRQRRRIDSGAGLMQTAGVILLGFSLMSVTGSLSARSPAIETAGVVRAADLPEEARETLALIKKGGPLPYRRDGLDFANREGRLPHASRGTYREYTVRTPGSRDRGARRIIASGSSQFWYTDDHYRNFRRIVE